MKHQIVGFKPVMAQLVESQTVHGDVTDLLDYLNSMDSPEGTPPDFPFIALVASESLNGLTLTNSNPIVMITLPDDDRPKGTTIFITLPDDDKPKEEGNENTVIAMPRAMLEQQLERCGTIQDDRDYHIEIPDKFMRSQYNGILSVPPEDVDPVQTDYLNEKGYRLTSDKRITTFFRSGLDVATAFYQAVEKDSSRTKGASGG